MSEEKPKSNIISIIHNQEKVYKEIENKLEDWVKIAKEKKLKAFVTVAITEEGSVIHHHGFSSDLMLYSIMGALEISKDEILKEII